MTSERFIGEAFCRRVLSRLGFALLAGAVTIQLVSIVLLNIYSLFFPTENMSGNAELAISSVAVYLCGMPVTCLIAKGIPHVRPIRNSIRPARFFKAFLLCYAIVFFSNLLGNMLTGMVSFFRQSPVDNSVLDLIENTSFPVQLLFAVLIAPVVEELVFRKLIVDRTLFFGDWTAIFISGVTFGLFHGNLNQFAYAFTLGMFLAYLYIRIGNIRIPIVIHMLINGISAVVGFLLTKGLDFERLLSVTESADPTELLLFVCDNLPVMLAIFIYTTVLMIVVASGSILLILSLKKFRFLQGEIVIPRELFTKTVFVNPGMLSFAVFFVFMIILQLFE